jgi:hypothetical protein
VGQPDFSLCPEQTHQHPARALDLPPHQLVVGRRAVEEAVEGRQRAQLAGLVVEHASFERVPLRRGRDCEQAPTPSLLARRARNSLGTATQSPPFCCRVSTGTGRQLRAQTTGSVITMTDTVICKKCERSGCPTHRGSSARCSAACPRSTANPCSPPWQSRWRQRRS